MVFNFSSADISMAYRQLHKIPEPEFKEFRTSEFIWDFLSKSGLKPVKCAGTGIYADIAGKPGKKKILFRADIDALPISEESGVEFASENPGYMHACGHDMHTACLLFAAKTLNDNKDKFCGTVRVLFQPAEEGSGGALPMINEGAAEGVTAAFAMHVEPLESVGTILYKDGGIMASPDDYKILIKGRGGHGAEPEKCINPITAAAKLISRYNKIKEVYFSNTQCVTTVCTVNSGTMNNIIPDTLEMTGTARSFDAETRAKLKKLLEFYAEKTAGEFGADVEFTYNELYPPTISDSLMNEVVIKSALETEGITQIKELEKGSMTGDDFAYFTQLVPSSYFKLGVGGKGNRYPLHSAKFRIDEKALMIGCRLFVNIACRYLSE
ncbi:MAG: amidohydrolase [Clostridia bacterium]|nr:amidohydrolase [Clostridia bacterium]